MVGVPGATCQEVGLPVREQGGGEHQLHLRQQLLVEAGVDDPEDDGWRDGRGQMVKDMERRTLMESGGESFRATCA